MTKIIHTDSINPHATQTISSFPPTISARKFFIAEKTVIVSTQNYTSEIRNNHIRYIESRWNYLYIITEYLSSIHKLNVAMAWNKSEVVEKPDPLFLCVLIGNITRLIQPRRYVAWIVSDWCIQSCHAGGWKINYKKSWSRWKELLQLLQVVISPFVNDDHGAKLTIGKTAKAYVKSSQLLASSWNWRMKNNTIMV